MNPYAPHGPSVQQRLPQFPARQFPVQQHAPQFPVQQWAPQFPAQQFPVGQVSEPYHPLPFTEARRPEHQAPHLALVIAFGVLVAALLISTVLLVRGTSG